MPNVQEALGALDGASASDVNTDAGFDAALARQAGAEPTTPREPSSDAPTRRDPSRDTAADIIGEVNSTEKTNIADGLTIKREPTDEERELAYYGRPDVQEAILRKTDERLGSTADERHAERQQTISDLAELQVRRFSDLLESGDQGAVLDGLVTLRGQLSSDQFDNAVLALAQQVVGVDLNDPDPDLYDEQDFADLQATIEQLHSSVDTLAQQRELAQAHATYDNATAELIRSWPQATEQAMQLYFHRQGVTSLEEANRRIEAANETAATLGIDLGAVPLDNPSITDWLEVFARLDAANVEVDKRERTHTFHQSFVNAPSTKVGDGLEVFGANGWQRVNEIKLDPPAIPTKQETLRRAYQKRERPADIKRALLAPEGTSIKDGFTINGKPVEMSVVDGSREQAKRDAEEARVRSRY